jgi:small conductance mechanosensitive channel
MSWATDNAYALKSLGGDAEKTFRSLDRELEERAESLAGRLQVAVLERDRLRAQMKSAEDTGNSDQAAELKSRLRASETRIHGVSESLNRTIDLLNRRGRNTAEYGQVVIQATGEITEDILNPRVLLGLMRDAWKDTLRWFRDQGPGIGVKLLILLVFVLLFRIGAVLIWGAFRMFQGREKSQLLTDLVGRMLRPVATFLGLGAGLWFLGVNPATLLAGVGVAGLIIGFALQDSLSNLAAGVFILVYRPYDVDDIVFAGGVEGRVKQMGLANTTILTFDNRKLFVPNTKIWGEVIENRSAEKIRRVETIVRISNQDDLEGAFEIIRTALEEFEGVHAEPVPSVFVANFADFWIEIGVWTWVDSTSVWSIKTQLRPFLRKKLQDNGIQLPFRHTAEGLRET